jgi:hypothetical protein
MIEAIALFLVFILGWAGYAFRSYLGAAIPAILVGLTFTDWLTYEPRSGTRTRSTCCLAYTWSSQ